jgi:methionyl aminopeptidase
VNKEVVHGIPSRRKLRGGDLVGIDAGAMLGGWIGDACYTYPVGEIPTAARQLLEATTECLEGAWRR